MTQQLVDAVTIKTVLSKSANVELIEYIDSHLQNASERKMIIEADEGSAIRAVEFKFTDQGDDLSLNISTLMSPVSPKGGIMYTYINAIEPILSYLCDYSASNYIKLSKDGGPGIILAAYYAELAPAFFDEYETFEISKAEVSDLSALNTVTDYENLPCFTDVTHTKALEAFLRSGEKRAQIVCTVSNAIFYANTIDNVIVFKRISTSDTDRLLEAACFAFKGLDLMNSRMESMHITNNDTKEITNAAYKLLKGLI